VPNAAAGETINDVDTKLLSSPRSILKLFDRTCVHTGWLSITPNVWRKNRLMAAINVIEHCLPNEVGADRVALEAKPIE
jgi:hypothetical protein